MSGCCTKAWTRDAASKLSKKSTQVHAEQRFRSQKVHSAPISTGKEASGKWLSGDDFIVPGSRCALAWLKIILEARFELKTALVGHGASDTREGRVLNRIIRATADGCAYEDDQRPRGVDSTAALNLTKSNPVSNPWRRAEEGEGGGVCAWTKQGIWIQTVGGKSQLYYAGQGRR